MYTESSSLKRIATEDTSINGRRSLVLKTSLVADHHRKTRDNRLKTRPKLPKNRVEFLMVLNEHPSHFITEIDEILDIGVILTNENLGFIASSSHIWAGGTFTFCAINFYQLYIFDRTKNGNFVPCIFTLLPDKKEKTYI